MVEAEVTKKSRRHRGKKTIGFAQETVTKADAEMMLLSQKKEQIDTAQQTPEDNKKQKRRNKKGKGEKRELNVKNAETNNSENNSKENTINGDDDDNTNNQDGVNGKKSKKRKNKKQRQDEVKSDKINDTVETEDADTNVKLKKRKNKQQQINSEKIDETIETEDADTNVKKSKKRKRKAEQAEQPSTEPQNELDPKKPKINKEESIRAKKRRKFAELLKQKKDANELEMQQKCLSYLSLWKHSRSQWKFEKLKQIWLQTNLYDDSKIPDEFFQTVVDYFNSARGKVRDVILKESLGILEKEDAETEKDKDKESDDEDAGGEESEVKETKEDKRLFSKVKYTRARNIVQLLNE